MNDNPPNTQSPTGNLGPAAANPVPPAPSAGSDLAPPASSPNGLNVAPTPQVSGLPQPPEEPATLPEAHNRASRAKIARLPKALRDQLNFMLRDGVEHSEIIAKLGEPAKDLTPRNISTWLHGPTYQHWLFEQQWREDLRADQESASDLVDDFDSAKFNQGALQLAATRLFLAFRHLDSHDLNQKLGGNAQSFARLVHALARASRESTNIQKYRDACAQAVAAELKQLNIERDLSDNEYALIMKRMDKVFKVGRPPKPADGSPTNGSAPGTLSNAPGTPK